MSRSSFDKYITVFSPEGSLYQVEYAFKAVKYPGLTTVAVRGKDSVVVVTQHQVPDKLMRSDSITAMFVITEGIGCCITGRAPDGKALVQKARQEASSYKRKFGLPIPVSVLAKRMADKAQVFTQEAGTRPMGATLTFIGMDVQDSDGSLVPNIYKVDPAGYYVGYHATASGAKEIEGFAHLERRQKQAAFSTLSEAEAAMCALGVLQEITGISLKARDVEVGRCTAANPKFSVVAAQEVEAWLTQIAEKDS
jgi:20S proteasome subunit alpha 1